MNFATQERIMWQERSWVGSLDSLVQRVAALGTEEALNEWRAAWPDCRAAYVHGQRHDLWWEFALSASFRWQGHLHQMEVDLYRRRLARLTGALGLETALHRRSDDLSPSELAKAGLALALLPRPDLLVWEEPFGQMTRADRRQTERLFRELEREEDLTVVILEGGSHRG